MEDNYDREGANKNKLKYVLEKQVVGSSKGAVSQNLASENCNPVLWHNR